jgi:uncharacterized membrane protein
MKYIFLWLAEFVLIAGVALVVWHDYPDRRLFNMSVCAGGLVIFTGALISAYYWAAPPADKHPEHTRRTPPPI